VCPFGTGTRTLQPIAAKCGRSKHAFGYRNDIALALHLPHGRHFVIGVNHDRPCVLRSGSHAYGRRPATVRCSRAGRRDARSVSGSSGPRFPEPDSRELETLRWTLEGKTAWELARFSAFVSRRLLDISIMRLTSWAAEGASRRLSYLSYGKRFHAGTSTSRRRR